MATPNSTFVSYASPADMLVHYDIRVIADLIGDTGVRQGGSPNPNPSNVIANATLARVIFAAAGMLEAAFVRAKRYDPTDLIKLVTPNLAGTISASGEFLIQLNCDLAMGLLYRRRPDKGVIPPFFTAALEWLESIASGERVFSFEENEQAGLPYEYVMTAYDWAEVGLAAQQAYRYFGRTADLMNPWQQGGLFGSPCGCGPWGW